MTLPCPACQAANDEGAESCFTCGQPLVVALGVGSVIAGRYEIRAQLGRGGMGVVYRAHDRLLDEPVAIKVLRPEVAHDPEISRRFQSEIKLARRVSHKNVARIHEYGEDRGLRYISMELLEGVDLRQILREQKRGLPLAEAFAVCLQTADGLQAIHDVGVIHRDLKTPNIMRDARGQVRLMDFGIAKEGGAGSTSATATGLVMGTPEYMSPEQARGEKIDFRTDIYALGILIFEVFTGRVPFKAETPLATILKHLQEAPPLDDPDAAGMPESVKGILRRALAKNPQERFQTVQDLADELRAARDTGTGPLPTVAVTPRAAAVPTLVSPGPPTLVPVEPTMPRERVPPPPAPAPPAPPTVRAPVRPPPPVAPPPVAPAPRAPARPPARPSASSNVGLWVALGAGVFLLLAVAAAFVIWRVIQTGPPPTTLASLPTPPPLTAPSPPATTLVTTPPSTMAVPTTLAPPTAAPVTRPPATPPPATVPVTTVPPPPTPPPIPAEVVQLMGSLGAADANTRWHAAEALGNQGSQARAAVPALIELLRDRQEVVQWRAAEALGKIGPEARAAVPALALTLGASGLPATEAAKALGRIGVGGPEAVTGLSTALGSNDVYLRREVAKALARIGPAAAGAVPRLAEALKDKDKVVRMESARALGRMGGAARSALPELVKATQDGDDLVRQAAAEARDAIERAR